MRFEWCELSYYHCDICHKTVFVEDLPNGHPDKLFALLEEKKEEQKRNEGEVGKRK